MTEAHPSPRVAVIATGSDSASASWLSRALSRWRTPRNLVRHGRVSRRVEVVAPDEASFLVVVCSPRAKDDEHIASAVSTFGGRADRDRVIALLVDGDPADAFPPSLYRHDGSEPLAADVRVGTSARRRTELLRIVAPMLGCSYDDLRRRDQERRVRRLGVAAGVGLGVAALLGALSVYALQQASAAEASRLELEETRARAEHVNHFVGTNLFAPLLELDRLDILRPSTDAQMAFYRNLPMPTDHEERAWRAVAVRRHGFVLTRQGEFDEALTTVEAGLEMIRAFQADEPNVPTWAVERVRMIGLAIDALENKGDTKRALTFGETAAEVVREILVAAPSSANRTIAFGTFTNLGDLRRRSLDYDGAEAAYAAALAEIDAIRLLGGATRSLEAGLLAQRASLDAATGDLARADKRREAVVALRRAESDDGDIDAQARLASALEVLGDQRRAHDESESAAALLEEAYTIRRRLAARDPTNLLRRMRLAESAALFSTALDALGQKRESISICRDALATFRMLRPVHRKTRVVLDGILSAAWRLARLHRIDGDSDAASSLYTEALGAALDITRGHPSDARALVAVAALETEIAQFHAATGNIEQALVFVDKAERRADAAFELAPDNPDFVSKVAATWTRIGYLLREIGYEERATAAHFRAGELSLLALGALVDDEDSDR